MGFVGVFSRFLPLRATKKKNNIIIIKAEKLKQKNVKEREKHLARH